MKHSYIRFLAKANTRGNQKSSLIVVLMCMLVIALTVISCFTAVTQNAMDNYKNDLKARSMSLEPWLLPITDDAVKAISNVEHVEFVDDTTGIGDTCLFDILDINSENETLNINDKNIKDKKSTVYVCGLTEHEKKEVIAGESLEDSPEFSCIVPSLFYPFEYDDIKPENLDYIDGTSLIGKTITVKGYNNNLEFLYNYNIDGALGNEWAEIPSPEYKLKIIGTYYCTPSKSGFFQDIYVSRETGIKMMEMAFESAGIDLSDDSMIVNWWNNPSLHNYVVIVDEIVNSSYVFNQVNSMGYSIANSTNWTIHESTIIMANLFSTAGTLLIFALFILAVIMLVQFSITSFNERKSYIGLLKAVGYKNRQIFTCLCYEQFSLTLKAFLIGGSFSALIVAITNFIFKHGSYQTLVYIIDWRMFLTYLCVSLAISVLIPFVCQLIVLKRFTKIESKDAMNNM